MDQISKDFRLVSLAAIVWLHEQDVGFPALLLSKYIDKDELARAIDRSIEYLAVISDVPFKNSTPKEPATEAILQQIQRVADNFKNSCPPDVATIHIPKWLRDKIRELSPEEEERFNNDMKIFARSYGFIDVKYEVVE